MSYRFNLALEFQWIVKKHSERPALIFSTTEEYTYEELNCQANRLARALQEKGVGRRSLVGISGNKSFATFATIVACWKLGAPYVVVDPSSPTERLSRILSKCCPAYVLVTEEGNVSDAAVSQHVPYGLMSDLVSAAKINSSENLSSSNGVIGTDPAYVMFTSGSTGFPKGAVMTHANVLNLIKWSLDEYGFGPEERLTNVNPLYFDNSVFDMYSGLFSGAAVVPFTTDEVRSPGQLVRKIDELKCTSWFSVPSLLIFLQTLRAFSKQTFTHIRRYIFGGEGYPKARLKELFDLYAPEVAFYNVYGPTECTCICSSYRLSKSDFEDLKGYPPLGRLINNFDYVLLDPHGRTVEAGEQGELCLIGPNVGLGYYNDPERTRESFQLVADGSYAEYMYKTGDLVNLNQEDGLLWISGRIDNQIKRMGYRIELEEIENALCCIQGVSRAALVFLQNDNAGFIGAAVEAEELDSKAVLDKLSDRLPEYMLPDQLVIMPLPVNANGKVDRLQVKVFFQNRDR